MSYAKSDILEYGAETYSSDIFLEVMSEEPFTCLFT